METPQQRKNSTLKIHIGPPSELHEMIHNLISFSLSAQSHAALYLWGAPKILSPDKPACKPA